MAEKDPEQPDPDESPESEDDEESRSSEDPSSEDPSPEDLAREVLDESDSPESVSDPQEATSGDSTPPPEQETGADADPDATSSESTSPMGSGSIKEMLEQEAERAREEEEPEDEEELPEGYLTIDQLPEPEPRTVPSWLKTLSGSAGVVIAVAILIWYVILPLSGSLLSWRIHTAFQNGDPRSAARWVRFGRIGGTWLIKHPDPLVGDYLKHLLDHGRLERFEREYRSLKLTQPTPRIHQAYTQYLLHRGRWKEARTAADRLLRFPRADMKAIGNLYQGKAQMMMGSLGEARNSVKKARLLRGADPGVIRVQRDLALRMGEYQRALSFTNELREWKDRGPDRSLRPHDFLQTARLYEKLGRYRAAEQMLQKGLQIQPGHRTLMRELLRRYVLEKRWQPARALLTRSSRGPGYRHLYPLDPFGWWTTAEWELSRERPGQAIPMLERARALNGRNPEVHRLLGELHLDSFEQPRLAVRYFERAHGLGLRRLRFLDQFARAYYRAGRYRQAARQYTRLYEQLDEKRPALLYNIGSSYLGAGELEQASSHLKQAHNQGFRSQGLYVQWGLAMELQGERERAFSKLEEGLQWADRNNLTKTPMQDQLDRMFENTSPRPLSDWLAPLETHQDIAHWKQVQSDTAAAVAVSP